MKLGGRDFCKGSQEGGGDVKGRRQAGRQAVHSLQGREEEEVEEEGGGRGGGQRRGTREGGVMMTMVMRRRRRRGRKSRRCREVQSPAWLTRS